MTPTLQWSEQEPPAQVQTTEQLEQLLEQLRPKFPLSVVLHAHASEAHLLLGFPESFVYIVDIDAKRYFITVGDAVEGVVSFHLLGQHHTEFERRHLIPVPVARRALREFFETGRRSESVQWEESHY